MTEYRCDHDPAAVCWRCSDQVPWWREARERKGLTLQRYTPPIVAKPIRVFHDWWWKEETEQYECAYCPATKKYYGAYPIPACTRKTA